MAGFGRKVGVVGFVLSIGVACTQLFGERQNTLAPPPGKTPTLTVPTLQPGVRVPGVCTTAEMRCDGALLQTCSDDLASWVTIKRCGAAALCQANPATCLAATCSEDEMTCAGAVLQKCNADRTGWDVFDTCLSPAHCNADQRQCLPEPCTPGARRCDRSELDQSPVLEVCRDDRGDWAPLDSCVTRELCDQTLTAGTPGGGLAIGSDGMVQVQAPATPDTVARCNLPACTVGEVRCDGARLQYCSDGRTGWLGAEECASEALCAASLSNVTESGIPTCMPPACGENQHRCTEEGVLQVCAEDRAGFRNIETCIGPPFCNAVLADQGQSGCRDAPCAPGEMQCNGVQIQVCRDDRTALDNSGAPCESAALCNATDPFNTFCDDPACRRGATSGDEFICAGAQLQRCNETLTGYDTLQTCTTPALCDASQRQNGCRPPVCQPGQHNCSNGFLQTCNADQTGFDNTENCGSQAQCDANAGRCADPCEPGSTRCNETNGDLERCNDRLTGWQPIADCQVGLCNLAAGRCNVCKAGEFSCADGQLRQCAADGSRFERQNIGPECALPLNGAPGVGIRGCQGNTVVVNRCDLGCTNGTCHVCSNSDESCVGNTQHHFCNNGFFGPASNCADANRCNGTETCQGNRCVAGQALNCPDEGNRCTSNFCDPAQGCVAPAVQNSTTCDPPSGNLLICTNGNPTTTNCGTVGCAPGSTSCNNCRQNRCANNQLTVCNGGLFGNTTGCPDTDTNPCTVANCASDTTCGLRSLTGNEPCMANGRGGNCQQGTCRICTPNAVTCNGNALETCNGAGTAIASMNCPTGNACQGNQCRPTCTGTGSCGGNGNNTFTPCNNGTPGTPQDCNDPNANDCVIPTCTATGCNGSRADSGACTIAGQPGNCSGTTCVPTAECAVVGDCDDDKACTADSCTGGQCNNDPIPNCIACTGNARSCVNNQLTSCISDRQQTTSCGTAGCSSTGTRCNVCVPNSFTCDSVGTLRQCATDGTGFANAVPSCVSNVARRACVNGAVASVSCSVGPADCFNRTCSAGVCSTTPSPSTTQCTAPEPIGPGFCDGAGACTTERCLDRQDCSVPTDRCVGGTGGITNGRCQPLPNPG